MFVCLSLDGKYSVSIVKVQMELNKVQLPF